MKQLFTVLVLAVCAAFVACSPDKPLAVAEKAVENIQKGDYEAYVEQLYMEPDQSAEEVRQQKEMLTSLLTEKYNEMLEKRGGLKSYSVVSEEVDEQAGTACVEFKAVYGNGDEESLNVDLKKDANGDWKVYQKK